MSEDKDIQKAKELYREMPLKEKIGYIFQYHWSKFLIGIIALIVIVSIIGRFTWAKEKDRCLGVGVYSSMIDINAVNELHTGLDKAFPEMTEDGKKEFKVYPFYLDMSDGTARMNMMYKLLASIELADMDVLLGDKEILVGDADKEYFMDLRELFSEEEIQMIDEAASKGDMEEEHGVIYVTYAVYGDNGRVERYVENIPMFICVEGTNEDLDKSIVAVPGYLGVLVNAKEIENTRSFIFSLLGIK